MKEHELISTIVENFITNNNFKFKKLDIKNLLKDSVNIKINNIKIENLDKIKILYIYFGKKNKCLTFTINDNQVKIDKII